MLLSLILTSYISESNLKLCTLKTAGSHLNGTNGCSWHGCTGQMERMREEHGWASPRTPLNTSWIPKWGRKTLHMSCLGALPMVVGRILFGDGRFGDDSGCGATGCTGRVCFAASFFRLTCLLSNISCTSSNFCRILWALLCKRKS